MHWKIPNQNNMLSARGFNFLLMPLIVISLFAIPYFVFFRINQSLWLDEAYSVLIGLQNFGDIISTLKYDNDPPVYYYLLAIWIRIFGMDPITVRILSGLFYFLCLISIYKLGATVYDNKTGLLCSFLYMVSPLAIFHSHNIRMYSLLGLLGILSYLFFFRSFVIKSNSKKDIVLYIGVNIIGAFTHYWFMFNILSQIISFILLFSRSLYKKFILIIFISLMPFLIFWMPIILSRIDSGASSYMVKPDIYKTVIEILLNFYGGKTSWFIYAAFILLIIFHVENFKISFQKISILKTFLAERRNLIFVISFLVSLLIPLVFSQVCPIYIENRYTIVTLLPFVMFIGALLGRFGNRFLVLIFCYCLIAGCLAFIVIQKTQPPKYSDKLTSEYLMANANEKDILIFTSLSRPAIDYYLLLKRRDKYFVKISYPSELAIHPAWRDVNKMLSNRNVLDKEADKIVLLLNDFVADDKKIWLFYGSDGEINGILKNKLDKDFILSEKKDLRGSFFNEILVYKK